MNPNLSTPETPEQTIARLTLENSQLRERIATTAAIEAHRAADEELIAKKMEAGLSLDQAVSVIRRQKKYDEAVMARLAARRPKILEILAAGLPERETRTLIFELGGDITTDEIKAAKQAVTAQ